MKTSVLLVSLLAIALVATPAGADCTWLLWGQDESFWGYKLLNVIPGPLRGNPYILDEYKSRLECSESRMKMVQAQLEYWDLPETKGNIKAFGGLRRIEYYACVPLPLKPQYIDHQGWK